MLSEKLNNDGISDLVPAIETERLSCSESIDNANGKGEVVVASVK